MSFSSITTGFAWMGVGIVGGLGSGLFAQVSNVPGAETAVSVGTGAGIGAAAGTAISMAIAAFGLHVFRPWLESRGLAGRVKILEDNALATEAERKADKIEWAAQLAAKDVLIQARDARIVLEDAAKKSLTIQLADLTARNIQLAEATLVHFGKIEKVAKDEDLTISDGVPDQDGPKVLLVEDDAMAINALTTMLTLRHCRTIGVGNVHDAIEALADCPDVVILDLNLPRDVDGNSDGVLVLRAIKDRKLATRVIVTTGRDVKNLDEVRALNPTAILPKPLKFFEELVPHIMSSPGARA